MGITSITNSVTVIYIQLVKCSDYTDSEDETLLASEGAHTTIDESSSAR